MTITPLHNTPGTLTQLANAFASLVAKVDEVTIGTDDPRVVASRMQEQGYFGPLAVFDGEFTLAWAIYQAPELRGLICIEHGDITCGPFTFELPSIFEYVDEEFKFGNRTEIEVEDRWPTAGEYTNDMLNADYGQSDADQA